MRIYCVLLIYNTLTENLKIIKQNEIKFEKES